MNSSLLKRSFHQIVDFLGGGWMALALALVILGIIVYFIFRSGKQIKIRIPFLPRGMNTIKIGRDDLKKLPGFGSKTDDPDEPTEKPVVGRLFDGLDALSGTVKKRYDIPLYLMISQYEATNTLLADVGEDVLERLDIKDHSGNDSGSCVILNHGGLLYHQSPELIAAELIHSRPERPLDGLILVVSVEDLLLENRVQRRQKIDWLFQQYWAIQNDIEFLLPVYLMVSGMESLQGFEEYGKYQNQLNRIDDIFGWSNPYSADSIFDPALLDEAFRDISRLLGEQISDVIEANEQASEAILVLPNAIRRLQAPLTEFASGVLNSSMLIHPPKFRGVYFTGQLASGQGSQHKFIQRLFKDKIFPEHALAAPVQEKLLSADRRLRRLQVVSAIALFTLVSWTGFNIYQVWNQSLSIEDVAERVESIWQDNSGFDAIQPSLQVLADLDASKMYCCGPMPWSLAFSPDKEIESFFQKALFGKRILPAMKCLSQQRLNDLVKPSTFLANGGLRVDDYGDWLTQVNTEAESYSLLRQLMGAQAGRTELGVYHDFSDLVSRLYGQSLPDGFGDNAALYIRGISSSGYDPTSTSDDQCKGGITSGSESWNAVIDSANAEIPREVSRIAAPLAFLKQIFAFESNSIEHGPITSEAFTAYVRWHRHIQNSVGANQGSGFCAVTAEELSTLGDSLRSFPDHPASYKADVEAFTRKCESALAAQMKADNQRVPRKLYQSVMVKGQYEPVLSVAAEGAFNLIDKMSEFTFSKVIEDPWTNREGGFFWSVDLLAVALGYADEYLSYAQGKFKTNYLPANPTADKETYLAQAVALAQLQRAMLSTIEAAKVVSSPKPQIDMVTLDRREAEIADRVANFSKALNPLLALVSMFEQLGLDAAKRRLLMQSHSQATELLEDIDALYVSNRVYAPRPNPNWRANEYPEALYGLLTSSSSKDYLAAQSRRSRIIARDYAQPVVVYLVNTEGDFKESDLLAKWRRTLIEVSKRENKDPSNDIDGFDNFFLGAFSATTFSNCHEAVKGYVPPAGNNIFAIRWRQLIDVSTDQCQRLQADNIKREYAGVATAFDQFLAPYYPFSALPNARPLSPKSLRAFLEVYTGASDGLAERMRVLAWKNADFAAAQSFLKDLDASLAILDSVVVESAGAGMGIGVQVRFDPKLSPAPPFDLSSHVSSKRLYVGELANEFPGSAPSMHWKFSDPIGFELLWASGSPYTLFTSDKQATGGEITYSAEGYWSLLRFVQKYRSARSDSSALQKESLLLQFDAQVQKSATSSEMTPIEVFVRMTLIGIDPKTQKPIPLRFPERFPSAAPAGA